jgi:hypothetical protein
MKAITEETTVFDPNKPYTWGPDATFTLNGAQFGMVLNALRATLATQEAQRMFLAMTANDIIEGLLQDAVERGVAKEAEKKENN